MNFQQLKIIREAARRDYNLTEVASMLYTSQSGVSRHIRELEDELTAFSTVGYLGDKSPNRADALVWALTALFPGIVKKAQAPTVVTALPTINHFSRRN